MALIGVISQLLKGLCTIIERLNGLSPKQILKLSSFENANGHFKLKSEIRDTKRGHVLNTELLDLKNRTTVQVYHY